MAQPFPLDHEASSLENAVLGCKGIAAIKPLGSWLWRPTYALSAKLDVALQALVESQSDRVWRIRQGLVKPEYGWSDEIRDANLRCAIIQKKSGCFVWG